MQRTGACNRCGQCCGAEGAPNQANPWPKNWFGTHRNWQHDRFASVWPYAALFGIVPGGDGKSSKSLESGTTRIAGGGPPRNFYWVWVDGRPCKDTSLAHDGSSYSLECPFLLPDPGDGSRPCGLAGTNHDASYLSVCYPEGPEAFETQAMVDQWEADHPLCSHSWVGT
jgi:hypothetical protein